MTFTAAAVRVFGRGVRWIHLQVASVPGWQLGESIAERLARCGQRLEAYESGMWGFGRPPELGPAPTPTEPQHERRSPRSKQTNLPLKTNTGD